MQTELTPEQTAIERDLAKAARKHGFGKDAVATLWAAVVRGGGAMAQFSHPEFGGRGQWMRSGMVMVGDMFNRTLAARVGALGDALARLHAERPEPTQPEQPASLDLPARALWDATTMARRPESAWWPKGLSDPATAGAQNDMRYAWFPAQRLLAIEQAGQIAMYDTADHVIGGVSQQQGARHSLRFTSQQGPLSLDTLERVDVAPAATPAPRAGDAPPPTGAAWEEARRVGAAALAPAASAASAARSHRTPVPAPDRQTQAAGEPLPHHPSAGMAAAVTPAQIVETLEQLASLQARGVLSADEFQRKKSELLSRL